MAAESSTPAGISIPPTETSVPAAQLSRSPSFDDDSAFEASISDMTDTTSMASSIQRYRMENGRTYHSYGTTEYWGPNDEDGQDHLDISHHYYTLVLDGKLTYAPITKLNRVLDLGTGTGIWCIDFADEHPEADVKGIDISPIQPSFVPPNCRFEVDDFNLDFLDENKYDLIHERTLVGSIPDWPAFYKKCFKALAPGGWMDIVEPEVTTYYSAAYDGKSFDDLVTSEHPLHGNMALFAEAARMNGMEADMAPKIEGWLEEAGFVNIRVLKYKAPIGTWPKDKKDKEVGAWNLLRLQTGLVGFYMRLGTSKLGWSKEEITVYVAKIKAAYKDKTYQLYHHLYCIAGQKPESVGEPQP